MAKPDPALLDGARYRFRHEITSRFSDMDSNRHINNVAIATMLEDARVRFGQVTGINDVTEGGLRPMVVSVGIEYLAQGHFPHPVAAFVATEDVGRSSWRVVQFLAQNGQPIAFARSVIVCTDGMHAAPMPEAFRDSLIEWALS
jgi:acyl-CoA thioester hydrolase